MELKGSKTEANLLRAFGMEAQSQSRYRLYAEAARREGCEQIGALFAEAAANELAHGRIWLKALKGIGTAAENLAASVVDENALWTRVYAEMAQTARAEGFADLAARFEGVAQAERAHEVRFRKLLENIRQGAVFVREAPVLWQCRNCGHLEWSKEAPERCPVCGYPQGFFELRAENY